IQQAPITAPAAVEHIKAIAPAHDRTVPTPQAEGSTPPLEDIFFDYDQALVRPDAIAALKTNLQWLTQHPAATVLIEGHCDERGSVEYNLGLGQRRAEAAADYLVKAGMTPGRLAVHSYGKELPFAIGHDESAWRLNRRAHFRLVQGQGLAIIPFIQAK
ncbi:MAG: OmpA family protein, partial [candidate division NC10 bacterium]|nr:OmpA family protein [candidate division NC10 bacterium]